MPTIVYQTKSTGVVRKVDVDGSPCPLLDFKLAVMAREYPTGYDMDLRVIDEQTKEGLHIGHLEQDVRQSTLSHDS